MNLYENNLYIYGGSDNLDDSMDDLWKYSLNKTKWYKLKPFKASTSHRSLLYKHYLIFFGGYAKNSSELGYNDIWLYNLKQHKWSIFKIDNGKKPSGRYAHSMIIQKHHLIIYGGASAFSDLLDDCYYIDLRCVINNDKINAKWMECDIKLGYLVASSVLCCNN